jgi:PKD repeat protein
VQTPKVGYLRVGWVPLIPLVGLLFFAGPLWGQATSTARNPTVVFSSPGTKQVTLQACNGAGCNTLTKSVGVLDPMPHIVSIASLPAIVLVGQSVALSAQSTGRPPLTHRWFITGTTGNVTMLGNPTVWSTTIPGIGVYLVRLEVQNVDGTVSSSSFPVTVLSKGIFADGFESGTTGAWQGSN